MSTIAAIATGPAAGGIGIIRLSGPASLTAARRVARQLPASLTARHAYFTRFSDADGAVLDEGLILYFQAPHSFTGEDVVELHAHGAPRLLSLLLSEVLREEDVRPATPGEFTRRAYLSGRIDLSRASDPEVLVVLRLLPAASHELTQVTIIGQSPPATARLLSAALGVRQVLRLTPVHIGGSDHELSPLRFRARLGSVGWVRLHERWQRRRRG